MAHELERFADGSAAFASAQLDAWHRLGTVTVDAMTAEEAMRRAYLAGWNVRKVPLTASEITPDGVTCLDVPEHYATVRTHPKIGRAEVLGVVGSDYRPIQNEQHCEFLNLLVDASGAHFETAGSLRGGRQTFVTMKLPETIRVGGVDELDLYIAALNSHDGSTAFRLITTPIRIVCANTQALALRHARSSFSVRHSAGHAGKVAQARQALGLSFAYAAAFQVEAERLIGQALTDAEFNEIVEQLWPAPDRDAPARTTNNHRRRSSHLHYLFTDAPTQQVIRGTAWAGLQAISEYLDHVAPAKDHDARALRTITSGTVADLKQRAYQLLAA
jgi:phage/plasmid-like protein (TIGR03299 family)